MLNTATRLASSAGAVRARSTTTTTAARANSSKLAKIPSNTTRETAGATRPARASASHVTLPTQMRQPISTLAGTIRRARPSSRVPRWTRGHSRANAHRNAGANMNGYT